MPSLVNWVTNMSSTKTAAALVMLIPRVPTRVPQPAPQLPEPVRLRLRRRTVCSGSVANVVVKEMLMAAAPLERIEAKISWQSIVIDLVIVTAPKPPGSRQLISPLMAVLEIAPAKVLHGAVRLQGLT